MVCFLWGIKGAQFFGKKRMTSEKGDNRLHEIHKGVQKMSFIQSLTIVKQDSATRMSPLERTKLKLIARVREQIQLAENAAYAPMHKKRIKSKALHFLYPPRQLGSST